MARDIPFLTERFIAHRGLHDSNLPENSMAAAKAAIEKGYGIELDVQLSRDGEAMVFHDADLSRMCNDPARVIDCDARTLGEKRLLDSNETIPTLEAFLTMVAGRVPVLIEIKNEGMIGRLEKRVAELVLKQPRNLVVMSFNPLSMAWFRKNAPEIPRGQLYIEWKDHEGDGPDLSTKLKLFGLYALNVAKPDFIARTARAWTAARIQQKRHFPGQPVLCWGAFAPDDHDWAIKAGVDNIIFEHYLP